MKVYSVEADGLQQVFVRVNKVKNNLAVLKQLTGSRLVETPMETDSTLLDSSYSGHGPSLRPEEGGSGDEVSSRGCCLDDTKLTKQCSNIASFGLSINFLFLKPWIMLESWPGC